MRHQVKTHLGQGDGVLVFDPSGFPKSGRQSVGVARQWCGRLGKVDNCQVAIYLGYVSRKGHPLVDQRLFLPKDWTKDKARLDKAGVPKASRAYRTRHQLALEMLVKNSAGLPHGWIAGDDEMGRPSWFRRRLATLGERYLLAVPANTAMRDLEVEPPEYRGRGRRPGRPWYTVETWSHGRDDEAWQRLEVRDGSKGPLVVEALKRRVVSRTHRRQPGDQETLVVIRYRDRDQQEVVQVDYYPLTRRLRHRCGNLLGWPKPSIALKSVFREVKAKPVWRTMRCVIGRGGSIIKRFRYWPRGFWSEKPNGGKKWTPAMTFPQIRQGIAMILHEAFQCGTMPICSRSARGDCNAMSLLACITGNSVTDYPR